MKETKQFVGVRLDPDEIDYLKTIADEYGVSLSQVIRWAISEYIQNH